MNFRIKAIFIGNLKKIEKRYDESLVLIPQPKLLKNDSKDYSYLLDSKGIIYFGNVKHPEIFLDDLNESLGEISTIKLKWVSYNSNLDSEAQFFERDANLHSDFKNEESYSLEIKNNQICILSINERGLFYGIQTLIQLLKNSYLSKIHKINSDKNKIKDIHLPEIAIKDSPNLKIRGITQDISRGQIFTVENAKRFIKIMSHYKLNFFFIYIEDVFAHPKHPKIGENRGALTIDEIKEIDAYAKLRFVEFVPIFECLGHVENILACKEYDVLAEFPGAHCFNIVNDEVYTFINDYISELSRSFSTHYIHLGCDESFDFGKYRSFKELNKYKKSNAYLVFYEKIYELAKASGNEHIIIYDDIVVNKKNVLENLNRNYIIMFWNYAPNKTTFPKLEKLLKNNYKVIVSPSMLNWQRNFPDYNNAVKNMINLTRKAFIHRNDGCLGVLTSIWGDFRYYSLRENEIFGTILSAALCWTLRNFDYYTFLLDFGYIFYGIRKESCNSFCQLFTLLCSSAKLYYRFFIFLPPLFYTYLFKHPFPSKTFKTKFKKYKEIGLLGNNCIDLYEKIDPLVHFERENFNYIRFGAELAQLISQKYAISQTITHTLNQPNKLTGETLIKIKSILTIFKKKFIDSKERYEKLWLKGAKPQGLNQVVQLFDFIIDSYSKKIILLDNGKYFENPYLPSEWIWVKEKFSPLKPRYFKKDFEIKGFIDRAMIQGIACNYMKLFVNNNYIGDVRSRFALTFLPIIKRVKVFDITSYLKVGHNTIFIEAYNFEGFKGAINLYGQIQLKDGKIQEILTDHSWYGNKKTLLKGKYPREIIKKTKSDWKRVKSYGPPPNLNGDIFKPNLLDGEISLTQDYFGIEGFFYNALSTFRTYLYYRVNKHIVKMLMRLGTLFIPLIIKKISPYN